jgi:hypothetical protein
MGDHLALSNSAEVGALLDAWRGALAAAAQVFERYVKEVGTSGFRAFGARWRDSARDVAVVIAPVPAPATLAELFATCDAFDAVSGRARAAGEMLLSPVVRRMAAAGYSRTYSESIAIQTVNAHTAMFNVEEARRAVAASQDGVAYPIPDVAALFEAATRGETSTGIYTAALVAADEAVAAPYISRAKDLALGAKPGAAADSVAHEPLLGISYECRIAVEGPATYDMERLTSKRRAAEYGHIAASTSGLNYKLVERLRTIQPAPSSAEAMAPAPATAGPAAVEVGPERALRLDPGGLRGDWLPTGGPHERVDLYTAACTERILEHVRPNPRELVTAYENAGEESPTIDPDRLTGEIYDRFAAQIQNPKYVPVTERKTPIEQLREGKYLPGALMIHVGVAVRAQIRRLIIKARGDTRGVEGEREAWVTAAALAEGMARTLRRHIAEQEAARPADMDASPLERGRAVIRAAVRAASPLPAFVPTLRAYAL